MFYIIQVDFGKTMRIVAVVTKGIDHTRLLEWVKKYTVQYSDMASTWTTVPKGQDNVSL
jgi:hypothetical protein